MIRARRRSRPVTLCTPRGLVTMRANPLRSGARVAIGLGILGGVVALGYAFAKGLGSAIAKGAGGAVLVNQTPAAIALAPTDKKSVQLSANAASNYGLPSTLEVTFAAGAQLDYTPASGVVDVTRTATGASVAAVGTGSALVTVSYPPDTTGKTDSFLSVGVV